MVAGVQRFLPPELGYDLGNPKAAVIMADLPNFGTENEVQKHLEEGATSNPKFLRHLTVPLKEASFTVERIQ